MQDLNFGTLDIVSADKSEYLRLYKPYIRSERGIDSETIILVVLKNPDGTWSKYFAALRIANSFGITREHKLDALKGFLGELYNVHFVKEIESGYTLGEIVLYKGTL